MIPIHLIANGRYAVLPEENRPVNFLLGLLTLLDCEADRLKIRSKHGHGLVACEPLKQRYSVYLRMVPSEYIYDLSTPIRGWLGSWEGRESNRGGQTMFSASVQSGAQSSAGAPGSGVP